VYAQAKKLTDDVVFHVVGCAMDEAKRRILKRSAENPQELYIREDEFDTLSKQYEPWDAADNYPVVLHNLPTARYIGQKVQVTIDRPQGSKHPKHGFEYPVNYGFVPYTVSGDGEELDAYVLGVKEPLHNFVGRCIGVIHRTDDDDDKLVVVPENCRMTDEEIEAQTAFQEQWFKHVLIRNPQVTKSHFGVYGVIIRNGRILLIKKARGPYTGMYDLPGGSPEHGEDSLTTLKREIREETGCETVCAENERFRSIIFSDFTPQSHETGVLQHNAVLYDVEIDGLPQQSGDGRDSAGATWQNIDELTSENATPYVLMAVHKK
jgi:inorganic pyrophosphatase